MCSNVEIPILLNYINLIKQIKPFGLFNGTKFVVKGARRGTRCGLGA